MKISFASTTKCQGKDCDKEYTFLNSYEIGAGKLSDLFKNKVSPTIFKEMKELGWTKKGSSCFCPQCSEFINQ